MTRKDSEKDVDRPHYYSQFWLDIAAGRRVIGGPKPEDEAAEVENVETASARKGGRTASTDGYKASAPVEPIADIDEDIEQDEAIEENELPNIVLDDADEIDEEDEVDEGEDFYDEEEEEEDDEWNPRGRKKAKPAKAVKPAKKPKREPRRSGF